MEKYFLNKHTSLYRFDIEQIKLFRGLDAFQQMQDTILMLETFKINGAVADYIDSCVLIEENFCKKTTEWLLPITGAWLIIHLNKSDNFDEPVGQVIKSTSPVRISLPEKSKRVYVRFSPGGLYRLTGIPQHLMPNEIIDAEHIFGKAFKRLAEDLANSNTNIEMYNLLMDFLVNRIGPTENLIQNKVVDYVIQHLNQPVDVISRKSGYTEKHLISIVKEQTGLAPKSLQILDRLRNTLFHYVPVQENLFNIATQFEFYDDSHFIRLFKKFFKMTPGFYQKQKFVCPNRLKNIDRLA